MCGNDKREEYKKRLNSFWGELPGGPAKNVIENLGKFVEKWIWKSFGLAVISLDSGLGTLYHTDDFAEAEKDFDFLRKFAGIRGYFQKEVAQRLVTVVAETSSSERTAIILWRDSPYQLQHDQAWGIRWLTRLVLDRMEQLASGRNICHQRAIQISNCCENCSSVTEFLSVVEKSLKFGVKNLTFRLVDRVFEFRTWEASSLPKVYQRYGSMELVFEYERISRDQAQALSLGLMGYCVAKHMETETIELLKGMLSEYQPSLYMKAREMVPVAEYLADRSGINQVRLVNAVYLRDISFLKEGSDDVRRHLPDHVIISADILKKLTPTLVDIETVLHHHEHFDGTGGPFQLSGQSIGIGGRIAFLAEYWVDLTLVRHCSVATALSLIRKKSGTLFDPLLVWFLKNGVENGEVKVSRRRNPERLTARQLEILELIRMGKTSKEIAQGLDISVNTVRTHLRQIMRKLGCHGKHELLLRYQDICRNMTAGEERR